MGAKEMTLTEEAQLQELAERAKRIRESLPSTAAGSTASELSRQPSEPETREAECGECRKAFTFLQISDAIPAPRYCRNCSIVISRAEEAEVAADQTKTVASRAAQILEHMNDAGANAAEHGSATLHNFDADNDLNRAALVQAQLFVEDVKRAGPYDPVRGLYLWGETGTGKTHLAVAVLRELLLTTSIPPHGFVYDHASELIARIQDTYSTKTSTFAVLDRRTTAKVWVLDDLGTERASADVVQHLTLIFTKRAMRATVITSNLAPAQFEQRNPELLRVGSRLGPAYFRVVEVRGRDRRFG